MHATLRRDIAAPLAVLRASMEALSTDFECEDPRGVVLGGAVEQIVCLGRSIQALVDFAAPPELHLQRCSLEELARAAYTQLSEDVAARTSLAFEDADQLVQVDGPLLTRCLANLLGAYALVGTEALVHTCSNAEFLSIHVLIQGNSKNHTGEARDLVETLAKREIERMGGNLQLTSGPMNWTRMHLRLPRTSGDQG